MAMGFIGFGKAARAPIGGQPASLRAAAMREAVSAWQQRPSDLALSSFSARLRRKADAILPATGCTCV